MVNRHRTFWSNMGYSKYEFEPEKFDEDVKAHLERKERKKENIKAIIEGMIKNDPVRQEETFQLFVEVLREWMEGKECRG